MVSRLNRNSPLPSGSPSRVQDAVTQRALDAIWTPLNAILKFLQPFVQQETWKRLPYNGDWRRLSATYQEPGYLKNPLGRVELRGWAITPSAASSTIAMLPPGYRPPVQVSIGTYCLSGAVTPAIARIDVDVDGSVRFTPAVFGANDCVTLDGVYFDTR